MELGPDPESIRNFGKSGTIRELLPYYLAYAEHESRVGPRTRDHYREGIYRALKVLGEVTPQELDTRSVLAVKADMAAKGVGPAWSRSVIFSLRSFLRFCRLVPNLDVMDPGSIQLPRIPRREVEFLTPDEVERFLAAIPIYSEGKRLNVRWLGCRSLMEVLLATGMRISEALSLKRADINFETGEANVIGKGNKERTVFFTPRALGWVKEYVNRRRDSSEWLFVFPTGRKVGYDAVRTWFRRTRARARLQKKVTAHILRHTCATTLLFNGCPIGHIKEILGHDRLETTCRYYLGVDKTAAKEAHRKYLSF